jgi:enoyl-CoA hydratase
MANVDIQDHLGSKYLKLERDGPIAWCIIDRPEAKNALTPAMYFGIQKAIKLVTQDPNLHALIITGTGDSFAPGGDMGKETDPNELKIGGLLGSGVLPFKAILNASIPVVSAVNGHCQGGGLVIALLCDVAIVSERAKLKVPELLRGFADSYYASILTAHVGVARARELMFTARELSAAEAVSMGLLARLSDHDSLRANARSVAMEILRTAPKARLQYKRMVNANYPAVDEITFEQSMGSDEVVEGFSAFIEKRTPNWVPPE